MPAHTFVCVSEFTHHVRRFIVVSNAELNVCAIIGLFLDLFGSRL